MVQFIDRLLHLGAAALQQLGGVLVRQALGGDGRQRPHTHLATAPAAQAQGAPIAADAHRDDRHAGIDGHVKGAFLERQQFIGAVAGAFGKDPDGSAAVTQGFRRELQRAASLSGVLAIDQDVAAQPEQLTEQRDQPQALLADRHRARRHDTAEQEQVVVGLMIGNHDETGRLRAQRIHLRLDLYTQHPSGGQ